MVGQRAANVGPPPKPLKYLVKIEKAPERAQTPSVPKFNVRFSFHFYINFLRLFHYYLN